jgi:hypothetical protein
VIGEAETGFSVHHVDRVTLARRLGVSLRGAATRTYIFRLLGILITLSLALPSSRGGIIPRAELTLAGLPAGKGRVRHRNDCGESSREFLQIS